MELAVNVGVGEACLLVVDLPDLRGDASVFVHDGPTVSSPVIARRDVKAQDITDGVELRAAWVPERGGHHRLLVSADGVFRNGPRQMHVYAEGRGLIATGWAR